MKSPGDQPPSKTASLPSSDPIALERRRTIVRVVVVTLVSVATMALNAALVNAGVDQAAAVACSLVGGC